MIQKIRYSLVLIFGLIFFLLQDTSPEIINGICLVLILLFGIPHGAVDHRIHLSTGNGGDVKKYVLKYLLISAGYIIWWLLDPAKALVMFIILSAYHFGQELLEEIDNKSPSALSSILWGAIILIGPIIYGFSEVKPYLEIVTQNTLPDLIATFRISTLSVLGILVLANMIYLKRKKAIDYLGLQKLIGFLFFITVSHFILPFIESFTLYFVFFHSFNAFKHQFIWLKSKKENYQLKHFILDLSGFSSVAIVGIVLLLWIIQPTNATSLITYFFILISLITLPHAITLDQFYRFRKLDQTGAFPTN